MTTGVADPREAYVAAFDAFAARRAQEPAWLRDLRRRARDRFAERGFPTQRDEAWRFTNLSPITREAMPAAPTLNGTISDVPGRADVDHGEAVRLVFVNGAYEPGLSRLPDGDRAEIDSLARVLSNAPDRLEDSLGTVADAEGNPFVALATAFLSDGAWIRIPRETSLEAPIHLVFMGGGSNGASDAAMRFHPRVLIVAEPGSRVSVVETHSDLSPGARLSTPVTEIRVGANARVEHVLAVQHGAGALHVGATYAHLARDARFSSTSVALGGRLVRNDLAAVFGGEGGECSLDGLYLASDGQHVDNQTFLDHAVPRCSSRELYKGIVDGRGSAVFGGRVLVRSDAQKTDARQRNDNLLLSVDGVIDTKPQLEIFADDVKCAHGATVGQLDEEALFYLRTRGLSRDAARRMLVRAFASEVVERVAWAPLRERFERMLSARLGGDGEDGREKEPR